MNTLLTLNKKNSFPKLFIIAFSCLMLLNSTNKLNAQVPAFNWAAKVGGTGGEYARKVAVDAAGNAYELISLLGTAPIDCDPGPGVFTLTGLGSFDFIVIKLDAGGNFIWAKQIGGTLNERGLSLALDNLGNVFITGTFSGTPDFDPGPGIYTLTNSSINGNLFILKLDAAGNFIWVTKSDNIGSTEGCDIKVDPAGNIFITGTFSSTTDFEPGAGVLNLTSAGLMDAFVAKYNQSGNLIWVKQIGNANDDGGKKVFVDGAGYIYFTGYFQLTVDLDPGAASLLITSNGFTDNYIVKLDGAGNLVWANAIGNQNYDGYNSIAVDAAGNVYTTGSFTGTVDFDPGAGTYFLSTTGNSDPDVYISKLNSSGNFIWAQHVGATTGNGDLPDGIALDGAGNSYIVGSFYGSGDFDPGAGVLTLTSAGVSDIFVLELSPAGNLIFASSIGGSSIDQVAALDVNSTGTITLVGQFVGTVDFDPGSSIYNMTSLASNYDPFTLKLGVMSTLPVSLLEFNANADGQHVNLTWSTATEINNDYFTIEKSANGVDFELLNTTPGKGTCAVRSNYFTVDQNPFAGTSYYRLKQTDLDGNEEYLKTVAVTIAEKSQNMTSAFVSIRDHHIFLSFNAENNSQSQITLFDGAGRLLNTEKIIVTPGINTLELKNTPTANGVYFIRIVIGEKELVKKFIL